MHKIGIIGDSDSVMGFLALGYSVHEAPNAQEAGRILKRIAAEDYAIIFIVENYAIELADEIAKYRNSPLPAVIPIPGKSGGTGYGMDNLKKSAERAVGADILFKE